LSRRFNPTSFKTFSPEFEIPSFAKIFIFFFRF
jgi:hypothetical protein